MSSLSTTVQFLQRVHRGHDPEAVLNHETSGLVNDLKEQIGTVTANILQREQTAVTSSSIAPSEDLSSPSQQQQIQDLQNRVKDLRNTTAKLQSAMDTGQRQLQQHEKNRGALTAELATLRTQGLIGNSLSTHIDNSLSTYISRRKQKP